MKAILLIDVPDNTEFDKDYRLTGLLLANEYAENVGIEFKGARLKPMPQKRVLEEFVQKDYFMGSKIDLEKMIRYVRARANNEIIDEILGERE